MTNASQIEANLVGSEKLKRRRAELVKELVEAFGQGGSQAATDEMTRHMDALAEAFADQLQELKKQL